MINNTVRLELISRYLEKSHRKIADVEVYKNLGYIKFKKAKKLLGIKFYDINKLDLKEAKLLLDYVLIESEDRKIINKPFNLITNHNTKRFVPCLVVLVGALEIKNKVYPIDFCFWISKDMIEEGEVYLTKSEIAEEFIEKIIEIYPIKEIIFDAGFCTPNLLKKIDDLGMTYICRFPKSRKIIHDKKRGNAKNIFQNIHNREFYFYHKHGYLNFVKGAYAEHSVQLIVIANTKEKLIKKDFYCLLTNNFKIKYPTVLKIYKKRGKIEDLFKKLKTYLGFTAINRHNEDYISDRFNLAFIAFVVVQDFSYANKLTFHQALILIKNSEHSFVINLTQTYLDKFFFFNDKSAFQTTLNS